MIYMVNIYHTFYFLAVICYLLMTFYSRLSTKYYLLMAFYFPLSAFNLPSIHLITIAESLALSVLSFIYLRSIFAS
jgi:hypothetical protein